MFYPSRSELNLLSLPNFSQATLMHAQGKSKVGSEENKNIFPRIQVAPILLRRALWVSFQKTTKYREGKAAAVRLHVWHTCQLLFHQWELLAKQVIFSPLKDNPQLCVLHKRLKYMYSGYIRGLNIVTGGVKMQSKKVRVRRQEIQ